MTRDEIIERMGWTAKAKHGMSDILDRIERIVRAAEQAEREAACRIVTGLCISDNNAREICEAIRARSKA
jgi:hypothetical protein